MNKDKGLSRHAINAIESLDSASFINWVVRGSIYDPAMGGSNSHPNRRLFGSMEWYLTCREISHAGDALNTYFQQILGEILIVDPSVWPSVDALLRAKDPQTAASRLKIQGESDTAVRTALRDKLSGVWSPETEIIVELRNKIVHQGGIDPERKVEAKIRQFPPGSMIFYPPELKIGEIPFEFDPEGKLLADARAGHWANRHAVHHIHILDQHLCYRFPLKRKRMVIRKSTFACSVAGEGFPFLPGTPLPVDEPPETSFQTPALPDFPDYSNMDSKQEIACAEAWRLAQSAVDEFVRGYCSEIGVRIRSSRAGRSGDILPHTLQGHDYHLEYTLRPTDDHEDERSKHLGVRFRFGAVPFVTVWGTNAQMRDFSPCELTDDLKDYLQTCVDHTLTR